MKYLRFTKSDAGSYVSVLRSSIMAVEDDQFAAPDNNWSVIHTYTSIFNVKESRSEVLEMIANPNKEE